MSHPERGGEVVQLVQRQVQRAADAGSTPWCSKGLFSQSTFSADFLTVCAQPFYAIACINSCARVWKTLSTGRKTTAWTQENTAHTRSTLQVGMWLPKWSREWSYTQFISWEESVLPPFQRGMQKNIYTCVKKTWFKYQLRGPSSFGKGMIFSSISKKKKKERKKKRGMSWPHLWQN